MSTGSIAVRVTNQFFWTAFLSGTSVFGPGIINIRSDSKARIKNQKTHSLGQFCNLTCKWKGSMGRTQSRDSNITPSGATSREETTGPVVTAVTRCSGSCKRTRDVTFSKFSTEWPKRERVVLRCIEEERSHDFGTPVEILFEGDLGLVHQQDFPNNEQAGGCCSCSADHPR